MMVIMMMVHCKDGDDQGGNASDNYAGIKLTYFFLNIFRLLGFFCCWVMFLFQFISKAE